MFSDAELQLAYKVGNVPFNMFPYPHFYIPDVFPADFYRRLQENLPDHGAMIPLEEARQVKGFKERHVLEMNDQHLAILPDAQRVFWQDLTSWLVRANFGKLVFSKFQPFIDQRFPDKTDLQFYEESLLVQDTTNYRLGPHTDMPRKVVTMLFYLPPDNSQRHLGTSIYLPKEPGFTCPGGPHHSRDKFVRLHTNPFAPNSLFAFFKTDNSFHGVEPVTDPNCRRWLLLYDIYVHNSAAAQPVIPQTPAAASNVKFSF